MCRVVEETLHSNAEANEFSVRGVVSARQAKFLRSTLWPLLLYGSIIKAECQEKGTLISYW